MNKEKRNATEAQCILSQTTQPTKRLIPVTDWSKYYPWPPEGGLRHLIFNEHTNGFAAAFKRVGRRVLIDDNAFWNIVEEQNREIK